MGGLHPETLDAAADYLLEEAGSPELSIRWQAENSEDAHDYALLLGGADLPLVLDAYQAEEIHRGRAPGSPFDDAFHTYLADQAALRQEHRQDCPVQRARRVLMLPALSRADGDPPAGGSL